MPTLPRRLWILLTAPVFALALLLPSGCGRPNPVPQGEQGFLFCFWNVEDLFDDHRDKYRSGQVDDQFDRRFASNRAALKAKLRNLSKVLLSLNDGKGPDIFAFAEVENERAAELLRQQLNEDLAGKGNPYDSLLFKETRAGRHISTGVITRLPVVRNRTRKLDSRHRTLEGHIVVNGQQLVIIASHWTSRITRGSSEGRNKYGDLIYGRFKAMYKANPAIDFLVCGDFNDDPDDTSVVKHLRAAGDREALTADPDNPKLFSLSLSKMNDLDRFGTLKYGRRWNLFDQIVVSPGLLDDRGWTVLPETLTTVRKFVMKKGKPWKFDARRRQGCSDHCPVTVRLKVQ